MFDLKQSRLESYLERVRLALESVGELPPEDEATFRIDFANIWPIVRSRDAVEQGLLLARLAANKPINACWTSEDLQLVTGFLEEKLHTVEWLEYVLSSTATPPLVLDYISNVLVFQLSGQMPVPPLQLSLEHISGQLRTLMEQPVDNVTKSLEAMERLHHSRVWLETMSEVKMQLYNYNPTMVALTLEQLELAESTLGRYLESHFEPSDAELAEQLYAEDIQQSHAAWLSPYNPASEPRPLPQPVPQPLPVPEDKLALAGAQLGKWRPLAKHDSRCDCHRCKLVDAWPSQWKRVYRVDCKCCICFGFYDNRAWLVAPMVRLKVWQLPCHMQPQDLYVAKSGLASGQSAWDYRDTLWTHWRGVGEVGALFNACFVVMLETPEIDFNVTFKQWLVACLTGMSGTHPDISMIVALLWATVQFRAQMQLLEFPDKSTSIDVQLLNVYFRNIRSNEYFAYD